MKYTKITEANRISLENTCSPIKNIDIRNKAIKNPTYFSRHMLGIRPQAFQHLIFHSVKKRKKRIAICCSRQIGKSIGLAIIAVWAAYFNLFPSGRTQFDQNTKVIIISRDDEAAKKLMGEIRSILYAGDNYMSMLTEGKKENFFTSKLSAERKDPDNKKQITFIPMYGAKRGCSIQCFPPTDAVRGNSADLLILDEAGFVDDEIYQDAIKPTVSTTGGTIILSSTPKGQSGFFFVVFDPFEHNEEHEYVRFWFPWYVCDLEGQKTTVELEKDFAMKTGKFKSFQQEYEALFTIDEEAFFDSGKVDSMFDDRFTLRYDYHKTPCSLGIDYGMTTCNTVLTITTKTEQGNIILLYQHEFELDFDDNLLMNTEIGEHSIPSLSKRFHLQWIIPDDCAQGWRTNKELASKGYPVLMHGNKVGWNFRSDQADRNRGYSSFKSALNQGLIKSPPIKELEVQMKALQAIDNKIYTSIRKPSGGKDDRIDSLMMSCVPFTILEEENSISSEIVSSLTIQEGMARNTRHDAQLAFMMKNHNKFIKQMKEDEEERKLWK